MKRDHQHRPPPWWPENEAWPPREWRRDRSFAGRFAGGTAFVFSMFVFGLVALARSFGYEHGRSFPPVFLAPFILSIFAFVFFISRRRFGRPLGEIVAASERVAAGDFTVRVAEYGPPWLRSVAAAFNSMTAKLAAHQQQRRDLMADIAHELRTPLAVMQGRLEGMVDGVYPRDDAHVAQVLEETRLLARLVDDLRTLAHSESGTLRLDKEPTDLAVLLNDAVASASPAAAQRQVRVTARIATDLPLLEIDPVRIREVVSNLLANAVRYSPANGDVVLEAAADNRQVTIRVRDAGPGISAADLPHIFDRFYRGATSTGSGLGLTIARNLVTAHGGTLTAESLVGAGTTMTVTLPRGRTS